VEAYHIQVIPTGEVKNKLLFILLLRERET